MKGTDGKMDRQECRASPVLTSVTGASHAPWTAGEGPGHDHDPHSALALAFLRLLSQFLLSSFALSHSHFGRERCRSVRAYLTYDT